MLQIVPSSDLNFDPLTPTIFHEHWWLDIATNGQYSVAEVRENGRVVGSLPYYLQKKMGFSVVDMPPLTHFVGPAILEGHGKPNTKFLRRLDITNELVRALPDTSAFYIKCHRDVKDVLAFQGSGFRAGVQFTHEVPPERPEIIWEALRDKARNSIRAAKERYNVALSNDPDSFIRFYQRSVEMNKGEANHKDISVCTQLIKASMDRDRGSILEARNADGSLDAAIFCAWDNVSSYYLMTSRSPTAHMGATSLLVWEAICAASKRNLIFDFDGISSEGCARSANNFTSILTPRFTATRESAPMRVIRAVKSVFNQKSFYY